MGNVGLPTAPSLCRILPRLFALGLLSVTPGCVCAGLDDLSSEYGNYPMDSSIQPEASTDAKSEVPTDGPADALTDPPADVPADVPVDSCACGIGQACVLGTCETCSPTWTYDHANLLRSIIILDQHFDRTSRTAYVASTRQDGTLAPRRGYLAELNTCRGTVIKVTDGATVNGKMVPGLGNMARHGNSLYAKLQVNDAVSMAGFARYNTTSHTFDQMLEIPPLVPGETQSSWAIEAAQSGRLYWWGEWFAASTTTTTPIVIQSDGTKVCKADLPAFAGAGSRAMTSKGNDIYASACMLASNEVHILRFDDSTCDISACNCKTVAEELPVLKTEAPPIVLSMKAVGNVLIVAGFAVKSATDWSGFIAQYNFGTKTWNGVYRFDDTAQLDGFTSIDADMNTVYATGFRNYVWEDPSNSTADVFVFQLPIVTGSVPERIPVPSIPGAFGVSLDGDGLIVSGYNKTPGDGRTVRCSLLSPKTCP